MSKRTLPPVLLTSCIYIADQAVNLKDPERRIAHTLESVGKWLSLIPEVQLIICDSSGYDFSQQISLHFPNIDIECIAFEANRKLVEYHGKGYGEGEIIKYALSHSKYLSTVSFFAKCTAKLWVENFTDCMEQWNEKFLCKLTFTNIFSLKPSRIDHVDTRFYMVNKQFYEQYFLSAHENLGGASGMGTEQSFLKILLQNKMQGVVFHSPPIIGGVGGGTGKHYNISPQKRLKEKLRYKLAKMHPEYIELFV